MGIPEKILILNDDYYAKDIGTTEDGDQFFVTTPFVPASKENPGNEFIAVYLFTPDGILKDARIDNLGPRKDVNKEQARQRYERRIRELGTVHTRPIEVAPFRLTRFGVEFGLIPRPPEDDEDDWWVIVEPGNYMVFTEPWDGEYDT